MKETAKVNVLGAAYTVYDCKRGEDETVDANFDAGECDAYVDYSTREVILEVIEPEPGTLADLGCHNPYYRAIWRQMRLKMVF